MKTKLTAGAEIDFLTADELRDTLRSWMSEITRGAKYRRRALQGIVDGAGNLRAGEIGDYCGPSEGFCWAITRVSVLGLEALQFVHLYRNEVADYQVEIAALGAGDCYTLNTSGGALVLNHGDRLILSGSGLTAARQVTVSMQIKEVPSLMAWAL